MHALVFDLDGTLVDTVYAHVLARQRALAEVGVAVDSYRLHRPVGSRGADHSLRPARGRSSTAGTRSFSGRSCRVPEPYLARSRCDPAILGQIRV
jgi:beta-phosphoglucomutase-like phosphatase (HAD superfamily)